MFGSNKTSDGVEITADGKAPVLVGERVMNNILTSVKWDSDECKSFTLEFRQSNGATFNHKVFAPDKEKDGDKYDSNVDALNKNMLHIATKMMTEQEYYGIVSGSPSFREFGTKLINQVFSRGINKSFNLKITYRHTEKDGKVSSYPQFPKYPNFIEKGDTEKSTFSTNPTWDSYERKTVAKTEGLNTDNGGFVTSSASTTEDLF